MSLFRALAGAALAWATAAALPASAQPAKATVSFLYLELAKPAFVASTSLAPPPPADEGVDGARLGLAEETATGRFLGIAYDMQVAAKPDEAGVLDAARTAIAAGRHIVVADVPAPLLLKLADMPEARDVLILDVATSDDALRGPQCRKNVLHLAPSDAMMADALMQYFVTKNWQRIMLLTGRAPEDKAYADALRHSARKFQVRIAADKEWTFNPAAQQADTGHYQVNTEVNDATTGPSYDILVAADVSDAFADELAYRTRDPRPIAGSAGLTTPIWTPFYDEYAATQLQLRFRKLAHRPMTGLDFDAWLAVRAVGEAAVRGGNPDPAALATFMRGPSFEVAGYKGAALSFRPWDGQLRQPVLLASDHSLVSISPQPGYLHQFNVLDTLGTDQPETTCHF